MSVSRVFCARKVFVDDILTRQHCDGTHWQILFFKNLALENSQRSGPTLFRCLALSRLVSRCLTLSRLKLAI
jgi:hypothetical protein